VINPTWDPEHHILTDGDGRRWQVIDAWFAGGCHHIDPPASRSEATARYFVPEGTLTRHVYTLSQSSRIDLSLDGLLAQLAAAIREPGEADGL